MKRILMFGFVLILFLTLVNAVEQNVFVLTLKYDKGNISNEGLILTKGFFNEPINQPEEGYTLEVISVDDKILYSQKFEFPLEIPFAPLPEWFDEEGNQIYFPTQEESRILLDTVTVELIFPYFDNIQRIDIKDSSDVLVLSIGIVPKLETPEPLVVSDIANESEEDFVDEKDERKKFPWGLIILIVVAVLVLIAIVWIIVHYVKKKEADLTFTK